MGDQSLIVTIDPYYDYDLVFHGGQSDHGRLSRNYHAPENHWDARPANANDPGQSCFEEGNWLEVLGSIQVQDQRPSWQASYTICTEEP
jgi:hypothetical protein